MSDSYETFQNLDDFFKKKGITMSMTYLRWVKDIMNTAEEMFHYDNLPNGLTSQIIENALMFNNHLCFVNRPELGGLVLCRYRYGGEYDLYWKPTKVVLLSISGQPIAENVPYEDIVLIRDNIMDIIPFLVLNSWIEKILDLENRLNTLTTFASFPKIFTGDKEQVNELKRLVKKVVNGEPIIVGAKNFAKSLESFDVPLPVKPKELYDVLDEYKRMALASIGIYGVEGKRERVVTSEILANNDSVDFVYTGKQRQRLQAIDEVNKRWGYNIIMHETYVENQQDEIKLKKDTAMAMAKANVMIEETKNEGKVEAAKVEGLEAAKIKPENNGGDDK